MAGCVDEPGVPRDDGREEAVVELPESCEPVRRTREFDGREEAVVELPESCELVRRTREFDERTVPAGLLAAHRVADGVWGRLVVIDGSLWFGFDDEPGERRLGAGDSQVIPPARVHHLNIDGAVRFVVEFHRPPGTVSP